MRQSARYSHAFFPSLLGTSRLWLGPGLGRKELASVSITWTSTMHSVPRAQKPPRRMSSRSSSFTGWLLLAWLAGQVFIFSIPRPWIKGSSCIAEGVKAPPTKWTSLSHILLWQKIMRPPFLQPRACCRVKGALQPLQEAGRLDGVMP